MNINDLLPKDKHDVGHMADLHRLTDEEIAPLIPALLEWVQDINWPVAMPVVAVLREHEEKVFPWVLKIMQGDDEMWQYELNEYLVPSFTPAHQETIKQIYCNMEQAFRFLKDHPHVAFATCEADKPRLRLFQIMKIEDTTLYFATSPVKEVYRQLQKNPHVEILAREGDVSVRCIGQVSFDVDEPSKQWIYDHNPVLPRLYSSYDKLAYFKLPVEQVDYYDLRPTPPLFRHFDLTTQTQSKGFVGERFCREIYLAGGCFWGTEHFFKQMEGVVETTVGFANGHTPHPTYQDVYTDTTGYAETVLVRYNPDVISLEFLLQMFFKAIDPTSLNRQGHDQGTRYRTGIYYTDAADLPVIEKVFAREQARYREPLVVEKLPLVSFHAAEDYHQDYLDKNPAGYCHLPQSLFEWVRKTAGRRQPSTTQPA